MPRSSPGAGRQIAKCGDAPVVEELRKVVPNLDSPATCPFGCMSAAPLHVVVVHLNDGHLWSREQIADWLDTLPLDLTLQPASIGD